LGLRQLSALGVVLPGTLGSTITYWVAFFVGRPFVMRFGGFFQIPPEQIERAERFTQRYQDDGIFFARLLPVICHSISIPAGIIRMGFLKFSVLTVIGSAIWCPVLTVLGQKVGGQLDAQPIEALKNGKCFDFPIWSMRRSMK
jgi:membrane protein DedA with SNARE-associated domain